MKNSPYSGNNVQVTPISEVANNAKEIAALYLAIRSLNNKLQALDKEVLRANRKLSSLENELNSVKSKIK